MAYWAVPTSMAAALGTGAVMIMGQHLFYQWLDGRAIDGSETPFSQAVAVGIGTAFAFIIKALLVVSVAIAYEQLFWRAARANSIRISDADALFGILSNFVFLLRPRLWLKYPVLILTAMIAW